MLLTPKRDLSAALLTGVFTLFTTTVATESKAASEFELANEVCQSIFGTDRVRLANEARRQSTLHQVRSRQGKVELVHSVPKWGAPSRTSLPGMEVLEKTQTGVHIRIDDRYGDACPQGDYELRVDDALGADGRVLAILPTALLIERQKALSYLPSVALRRTQPSFRMVWRSDFVWVAQQTAKGGGNAPTASSRNYPESKSSSKADRKKRNEEARQRAKERREKAKKSPKGIIDSLPTTQLAKELRGSKRRPTKTK